MTRQSLTIDLPESIYQRVKSRSQRMQRSVAEEVVAVITDALPPDDQLDPELEEELATLELFTDDELLQAARVTVPQEYAEEMQRILDQQQSIGLTISEQERASQLTRYYDQVMLTRAKAALLLIRRGYNMSPLA